MKIRTLDFETYYSQTYSLSRMTTEAYIRDPQFQVIGFSWKDGDAPTQWFTGTDQEIADRLHSLGWDDVAMCAHNCLFDASILSFRYGIKPKMLLDTLSMAQPILASTPGGSLAKLAQHFELGAKGTEVINALGKRREDFSGQDLALYAIYCINDTELTYKLYHKLLPYSTAQEQYIIDVLLRMYTDPVLVLDEQVLTDHLTDVQAKKARLLAQVQELCGQETLMSNDKLAAMLTAWDVDVPMKRNKNGEMRPAFAKTDEEFKALLDHEDMRVQTVVAARLGVKSTIEETRTRSFLEIASRGKLPIGLKYYAAHTGRAGGQEKVNPQNLPRRGNLRRAITAPPGHVLVACDSAQIEARVVAALAGQYDLVDDFARGVDIYNKFGSMIYGREINRKAGDTTEGHVAKCAVLGLGFGMGATKFQTHVKTGGVTIDATEALRVVHLYRTTYSKIKALWYAGQAALYAIAYNKECVLGELELKVDGEGIHLPNGMMIRYPHLFVDPNGEYWYCKDPRQVAAYVQGKLTGEMPYDKLTRIHGPKTIENVVQALARIVVFHQMCKIDQWCKARDTKLTRCKVVLSAHDETVVCAPAQMADEVAAYMSATMSIPPKWWPKLPIACEVAMGASYFDCK